MNNFWKKRIKNKESIANKMGIDSEKIQELMNGEREIEGKTLDKVLQAVEEEKMLKPIKQLEILQWYKDTDLKELRLKFGYDNQKELADLLKMDNSTLCNFERKVKIKTVSSKLIQLYNFYQNDFNRKTKKANIKTKNQYDNNIEVLKWYNKTDIKKLRGDKTSKETAEEIGLAQQSYLDIENKRSKSGRVSENMIKVYNYYQDKKIEIETPEDKEIWEWYKNTDLKALRESYKMNQYDLSQAVKMSQPCVSDVELKRVKSVSITMRKMYEFYNKDKYNNKEIETQQNYECIDEEKLEITGSRNEVDKLEKLEKFMNEYSKLKEENEQLKEKIKRYEELIDKIM